MENRDAVEVSIVMPCLNESATIEICVRKALAALGRDGIRGEVVVADNGSTDGSQELARRAGAIVVDVAAKGYGNALIGGITASKGRIVVMGDADDSYDFGDAPSMVRRLGEGFDIVIGNRFLGGIRDGAMPWKNRYIGNPVLSRLGRLFFGAPIGDFHCGLRAFTREAFDRLNLHSGGMEFATEMIAKASMLGMRMDEVPTTLSPDGRGRAPHLRPWRDGWRHLRFMLLYSPRWLFLYPGLFAMALGAAATIALLPGPLTLGGVGFDVHTLVFANAAIVIGLQSVIFAVLSRSYASQSGLVPPDKGLTERVARTSLEAGLVAGALLAALGLGMSLFAVEYWKSRSFGTLDPVVVLRWVVPGATCLMIGFEIILFSCFLSFLRLELRDRS